ncbi:hypothetical protein EVAR_12488_1 [Eumeta japonica]|uniref:Uncharacterized protein n=1 Tax=Eumeta variegata TaxID=151549 RepID=A0A4C1TPK0_EUMVA|nr:hypothetical protein EVAR_12488_1 [Eumeta japonica]
MNSGVTRKWVARGASRPHRPPLARPLVTLYMITCGAFSNEWAMQSLIHPFMLIGVDGLSMANTRNSWLLSFIYRKQRFPGEFRPKRVVLGRQSEKTPEKTIRWRLESKRSSTYMINESSSAELKASPRASRGVRPRDTHRCDLPVHIVETMEAECIQKIECTELIDAPANIKG